MLESIAFKLFLSILIGAAIGLERQSGATQEAPGGIRTFSIVSLMGALGGVLLTSGANVLFAIMSAFVALLILAYYVIYSLKSNKLGFTNELAVFFAYLLGFLVTASSLSLQVVIAIFVVVLLILSFKHKVKHFMARVSRSETESFISYAIIALVVMPFLPNTAIHVSDIPLLQTILNGYQINLGAFGSMEIFNPRNIWYIVVLVTGIDVFGYLLGKLFGNKRSFVLTSLIGGFISSTSTTIAMANKSKKGGVVNHLVGATLIANMASIFPIFLLVGPINGAWLATIVPTLVLVILSAAILGAVFLLKKTEKKDEANKLDTSAEKKGKVFSLMPALKFALILIAVKFVTKICLVVFGNSGFIISSMIASLAGLDAIVINLADMAGKTITFHTALFTLILVSATNMVGKMVYSFIQGKGSFALKLSLSLAVVIGVSFIGLFI
ncbi:MAG: hypothetical protein US42_C0002G0027 [Candidatus Magasanikbacteria bacterium GW2011_GWC2_37_14]|uniref:Uncharacterized protein n=1 Tax=Candidatus Magasanikbacteria bacterium GW2011_GWC2_37_14 TaxID=1619046 RepID=A0A0G0GDI4_9BACT|nr:MAG: hypothetical protein US42_C0002G0027 [Candidatus Magasanikbacteria bacterium GW2011_GWC2_37_14]